MGRSRDSKKKEKNGPINGRLLSFSECSWRAASTLLTPSLFLAVSALVRWDNPAGKGPGVGEGGVQSVGEKAWRVESEEFGCFSEKAPFVGREEPEIARISERARLLFCLFSCFFHGVDNFQNYDFAGVTN